MLLLSSHGRPLSLNVCGTNAWKIVEVTPVEQVTYDPEHPMFAGGSLGSCGYAACRTIISARYSAGI